MRDNGVGVVLSMQMGVWWGSGAWKNVAVVRGLWWLTEVHGSSWPLVTATGKMTRKIEPGGVRDASLPCLRRRRLRKRMTWGIGCWKDDEKQENGEIWWHGYR